MCDRKAFLYVVIFTQKDYELMIMDRKSVEALSEVKASEGEVTNDKGSVFPKTHLFRNMYPKSRRGARKMSASPIFCDFYSSLANNGKSSEYVLVMGVNMPFQAMGRRVCGEKITEILRKNLQDCQNCVSLHPQSGRNPAARTTWCGSSAG